MGFLSLGGRTTRLKFWLCAFLQTFLLAVLGAVFYVYAMTIPGAYENGGPTPFPTGLPMQAGATVWFVALAVLLWSVLCNGVRRLHDRGKSGWWLLLFWALPNGLSGAARQLAMTHSIPDGMAMTLLALCGLLFLWGLAEMGFLKGDSGDNRFGPDPLAA